MGRLQGRLRLAAPRSGHGAEALSLPEAHVAPALPRLLAVCLLPLIARGPFLLKSQKPFESVLRGNGLRGTKWYVMAQKVNTGKAVLTSFI